MKLISNTIFLLSLVCKDYIVQRVLTFKLTYIYSHDMRTFLWIMYKKNASMCKSTQKCLKLIYTREKFVLDTPPVLNGQEM